MAAAEAIAIGATSTVVAVLEMNWLKTAVITKRPAIRASEP